MVAKTVEHREAMAAFRAVVGPLRLRVKVDPEGFPVVPGRYGQIEWYCDGQDCHSCPLPGQFTLAVYTERPRIASALRALPGVRPHQVGDEEFRGVFLAGALAPVAGVIRARRRRIGGRTPEVMAAVRAARKSVAGPLLRATSGGVTGAGESHPASSAPPTHVTRVAPSPSTGLD